MDGRKRLLWRRRSGFRGSMNARRGPERHHKVSRMERKDTKRTDDRILLGLCASLSGRIGTSTRNLRITFLLLAALFRALAAVLYITLAYLDWRGKLLPEAPEEKED